MSITPDALFSGIVLSITTALSILASVGIALYTIGRQNKKAIFDCQRLQIINRNSALEAFKAMAADFMAFQSEYNTDFSKQNLLLHCKKLTLIEHHLTDFCDSDLPDNFIKSFRDCRLTASLYRTTIEYRIEYCNSSVLPSNSFDDLEIDELIDKLNILIQSY